MSPTQIGGHCRLVLSAQRVGASCRFVLRGPELGPTNRSSFATPEQSAVSMDEINPVIVEKRDQPRVNLGNTLCFDAMVFRHVNDEGMWKNKTELQRNSTRFFDLKNTAILNRFIGLPYASPYGFVRF